MPAELPEPTVRDYLIPIWERRWLIVALVVVITGVVYAYYTTRTRTYVASTKVYVGNQSQPALAIDGVASTTEGIADQALLLTSTESAAKVATMIGWTGSPAGLAGSVTAFPSQTTNFISITGHASSAREAARIANGFARQFIVNNGAQQVAANDRSIAILRKQINALRGPANAGQRQTDRQEISELQLANSSSTGAGATQIDVAQPPSRPTGHSAVEYAVLAAIASLFGSILLAFMLYRLDPRLKRVIDAASLYSHPVLATVVYDRGVDRFENGVPGLSDRSREAFRDLRVSLELAAPAAGLSTLLVTSAGSGEGKSTVARNLAIALAEAGRRVALIDADLRKGSVAGRLGVDARPGLTEVLAGLKSLNEVKRSIPIATLHVAALEHIEERLGGSASLAPASERSITFLPAGTPPANPPVVLESESFRSLLGHIGGQHDVVVIDSTPLTAVSDAIPLLGHVSGILLVARNDTTDRRSARRASELIARVPDANVVGVVVNGVPSAEAAAYGMGYGYGYAYGRSRRRGGGVPAPEASPSAGA